MVKINILIPNILSFIWSLKIRVQLLLAHPVVLSMMKSLQFEHLLECCYCCCFVHPLPGHLVSSEVPLHRDRPPSHPETPDPDPAPLACLLLILVPWCPVAPHHLRRAGVIVALVGYLPRSGDAVPSQIWMRYFDLEVAREVEVFLAPQLNFAHHRIVPAPRCCLVMIESVMMMFGWLRQLRHTMAEPRWCYQWLQTVRSCQSRGEAWRVVPGARVGNYDSCGGDGGVSDTDGRWGSLWQPGFPEWTQ